MPVYEYNCRDCRRLVSIWLRSFNDQTPPECPNCKGKNLQRRISRVIIAKGTRRQLNELDRGRLMSHYEGRDKGSQAAWARRMASELGEAGSDFRDMAEKVEAGEQVFDLYDPAPLLDHKLSEKSETIDSGPAPSSDAHLD